MSNEYEDLIQRIRSGDIDALIAYLELRRGDLMAFVQSSLGAGLRGKVEAEDIVQEISHYACQNLHEINVGEQDPFGWFCQIAKRKIVDAGRHFSAKKRNANREVGIHARAGESFAGIEGLLVASITSPSGAFSRKQKEFHLLAALSELPEEQRQALTLRYAENMPTKKIADVIGKSDGATRVLITRSLKKLEALLASTSFE